MPAQSLDIFDYLDTKRAPVHQERQADTEKKTLHAKIHRIAFPPKTEAIIGLRFHTPVPVWLYPLMVSCFLYVQKCREQI